MKRIRRTPVIGIGLAIGAIAFSSAGDEEGKEPASPVDAAAEAWKAKLAERSRWWSLQPPKEASPPAVSNPLWSGEPVDRFILARLDEAELSPAPPAGPGVLLRRLSFVLTGLPPKPEHVAEFHEAFAVDPDAALEQIVDELLVSPHFGERFARHWMDVVRYTDTYGYEWDIPAKGSWEYRDYLIRAFNNDIGYDQLIREQVAGDLLPNPRLNGSQGLNESMIGPMFFHLGEHRHGNSLDFNGIHQEMINNKVDAFSKTFLAMTVGCARCHDHKLDAISQADYYALAGLFMTPRWTARSIDAPGKNDAPIAELKNLRSKIQLALSRSGGFQPPNLKQWALDHPDALASAKIEDIFYPVSKIANETDESISEIWTGLATEWRTTRASRRKTNAEKFTILDDFTKPGLPGGWITEGDGLRHGHVTEGTPLVNLEGEALISQFLRAGYHTHALSSKLPGALRLPAPKNFSRANLSLQLSGGEWAGHRAIPQNAFLNERPAFFNPAVPPKWTAVAAPELKNGVTRVLTEITTASLNSNFPPRTGIAKAGKIKLPDKDEGRDKRSWFSLTGAVAHDSAGTPADPLDAFATLYENIPPTTADQAWERFSNWLTGAVNRWAAGDTAPGDVQILNWMLVQKLLPNDAKSLPEVAALVKRYREVEARLGFPRSANSMDERAVEPVNYRLNVRGDVYEDGPAIRRDFLGVFDGRHDVRSAAGSGRLELAQYLAGRDNPQTARVFVNRLWHWTFGAGIVTTPSDFGKLGGRPSHPELLDWLAIRFMKEGWSTRKLVKRLVLSRTFRQSGDVSAAAADLDPGNRLLHHYPTRRLEAEALRDNLLAVSGRLDPKLYGPPINPPRPAEDTKKRLFSGPLDSNGRRSLYLEMSIMQPPEFLVGFNLPDLKLPTGKRDVTNVPTQALIMLNDPFVNAMAGHWSGRLVSDGKSSATNRLRSMFLTAFAREPTTAEQERWLTATKTFATTGNLMTDAQAWTEVAHALFNTKEFLYYR